jgi:hypothetical protein
MIKLTQILIFAVICLCLPSCGSDDEGVTNQTLSDQYESKLGVVISSWSAIFQANYEIEKRIRSLVIGDGSNDVAGRMEFCGRFEFNAVEKSFVLDFGESCEQDGITYSGKIGYRFDGDLLSDDRLFTVFFEGFSFSNFKIDGVLTSKALTTTSGKRRFMLELGGGVIVYPDGTIVNLEMSQELEEVAGSPSTELSAYVFNLVGTSSGELNQSFFHLSTVSPVIINNTCFQNSLAYPTSGILMVELEDEPKTELNYGSGACDSKALLITTLEEVEIDFAN